MRFNLSEIELSRNDLRRDINLPKETSGDLAEFWGIMTGDGFANYYKENEDYMLAIAGHKKHDYDYHSNYIRPLILKLFRITPSFYIAKNQETLYTTLRSKALITFLSEYGFPLGKKVNIRIPNWIYEKDEYMSAFLRGLADTDFSLTFKNKGHGHNYPVIRAAFKGKLLVKGVEGILESFGISFNSQYDIREFSKQTGKYYTKSHIYICGKKNLELWMKYIDFKNDNHLKKFYYWQTNGVYPPHLLD